VLGVLYYINNLLIDSDESALSLSKICTVAHRCSPISRCKVVGTALKLAGNVNLSMSQSVEFAVFERNQTSALSERHPRVWLSDNSPFMLSSSLVCSKLRRFAQS
jgi:hypothetical protein